MVETSFERSFDSAAEAATDAGARAAQAAPPAPPVALGAPASSIALGAPASSIALGAPAPGQQLAVAVQAGQTFVLDPGARGLGLEHSGGDLSIVFPGAGTIRLEGFAALAESAAPPRLILPDGSELGADRLLALLDGGAEETPPIETAAGAETGAGEARDPGDPASSGGGSAYGDDLGGPSAAGLAALGTLEVATESGVPNFPLAEDLAAPASAAVTASDGQASAAADFDLTVANVNDAPSAGAIGDIATDEDQAFVYDVSASFSDVDAGDSLSFGATLAGGAALPGWLSIDPDSGVLSGTPDNGDVGAYAVTVTASDGEASAAADFDLTVDATVVDIDDPGLLGSANIIGSAGDDLGGDALRGSNGVDDIIYGLGGDDRLSGKGGDDALAGGDGDDDLRGEKGADSLYGGAGDDTLDGGHDGDNLYGGSGADLLDGDKGDDSLDGGSGADTLIGGAGDDQLQGGADADLFLFDFGGGQDAPGDDMVLDFDAGEGDVLRFVDVLDIGGDGPDLGDFSAAVSSVQDDGSDVTLVFEDGGSLLLAGLGTGAIDSVNALLSEIGSASVEVV